MCTFRYDDYEDGDRFKRVHAALPAGTFALMCTLFFDAINRDKKGVHGVLLCLLFCPFLCPFLCLLLCPFVVFFVVSFVVSFCCVLCCVFCCVLCCVFCCSLLL